MPATLPAHWPHGNLLAVSLTDSSESDASCAKEGLPAPAITTVANGERFETLATSPAVRIERIVSHGQATPEGEWYNQPTNEFVTLLTGSARLCLELPTGKALHDMQPGDWLLLPAHCRHRVEQTDATQPTVWLAVHFDAQAPPAASLLALNVPIAEPSS